MSVYVRHHVQVRNRPKDEDIPSRPKATHRHHNNALMCHTHIHTHTPARGICAVPAKRRARVLPIGTLVDIKARGPISIRRPPDPAAAGKRPHAIRAHRVGPAWRRKTFVHITARDATPSEPSVAQAHKRPSSVKALGVGVITRVCAGRTLVHVDALCPCPSEPNIAAAREAARCVCARR